MSDRVWVRGEESKDSKMKRSIFLTDCAACKLGRQNNGRCDER